MDEIKDLSINNENKKAIKVATKYNKSVYFLLPMLGLSIGINFSGYIAGP